MLAHFRDGGCIGRMQNPFAQPAKLWQCRFTVPAPACAFAEMMFEDSALSVSHFEADEEGVNWYIEVIFGEKPEAAEVTRRLLLLGELHAVSIPEFTIQQVIPQDWLALVARDFPPLRIGRFYIYGSHETTPPPHACLPLKIDAGAAFGSGEHGTTRGCLEALQFLSKRQHFSHALDVGCGSGILAMGFSALTHRPSIAGDMDAVAARVAARNTQLNGLHTRIRTVVASGTSHRIIAAHAPYPLIFANILARPLVSLAPALSAHLARGGMLILSGLLVSQIRIVLHPYRMQGLRLVKHIRHEGWATLILQLP